MDVARLRRQRRRNVQEEHVLTRQDILERTRACRDGAPALAWVRLALQVLAEVCAARPGPRPPYPY